MSYFRPVLVLAVPMLLTIAGCATRSSGDAPPRRELATIKADQASLKPSEALDLLRAGNERFVSGKPARRDVLYDQKIMAAGQYPHSIVLSCMDSRVPAELVFDAGLGDIFSARVAGNIVNPDMLGSLEYACAAAGAKLVFVMGHTHCGAVKGAVDGVKLGNLTGLLEKISPAVRAARNVPGEHSSKNAEFVEAVGEDNVRLAMDQIRAQSPTLLELEKSGKILIAGGVYDLDTGRVHFLTTTNP